MTLQQSTTDPPPIANIKSIFSFLYNAIPSNAFSYVGFAVTPANSTIFLSPSFNSSTIS